MIQWTFLFNILSNYIIFLNHITKHPWPWWFNTALYLNLVYQFAQNYALSREATFCAHFNVEIKYSSSRLWGNASQLSYCCNYGQLVVKFLGFTINVRNTECLLMGCHLAKVINLTYYSVNNSFVVFLFVPSFILISMEALVLSSCHLYFLL